MPDMVPVKSSHISAVGYDPAAQALHVTFKSGDTYVHDGVSPAAHQALAGAPSVGAAYHSMIRDQFPGRKLEAPPPA